MSVSIARSMIRCRSNLCSIDERFDRSIDDPMSIEFMLDRLGGMFDRLGGMFDRLAGMFDLYPTIL